MSFIQHLISFSDVTVAGSPVTRVENTEQRSTSVSGGNNAKEVGMAAANPEQPLSREEVTILVQLFKNLVKLPLEEHDRQIAHLRTSMNQLHRIQNEPSMQTLLALSKRNQELRIELENYQANQTESWADFKRRFNQQLVQIGMSISKLSKQND